jgi:hypothetical protein
MLQVVEDAERLSPGVGAPAQIPGGNVASDLLIDLANSSAGSVMLR